MPRGLEWWASSLQLSGLGSEQAELARQFLARAGQLEPGLRDQMAARIAGDVAARISPPPPPGTPPQYMLAAVLAERHRRELARLHAAARPTPQGVPWQAPPPPPAWAPPPGTPPTTNGGFAPPS
jgi:hypothetical protein